MKQWFRLYLIIIIILLGITVSTVVVIDPFFHYHKPIEGLFRYYNREPYQNPGIIKNYDYDTVILGSCMAENFKPSLFESLMGGKVIKIPHQAATTNNLFQYASMIAQRSDVKKIYWGIDIWTLDLDSNAEHDPVPKYLIDDKLLTDIDYLLNKDVFETYTGVILSSTYIGAKSTDMDTAWSWAETREFSQNKSLETKTDPAAVASLPIEERSTNFEDNMYNRIFCIAENNPDIRFTFFYPPYSIRLWKEMLDEGIFYERVEHIKRLTHELLQLDNVEIYNFQNIEDIVTNLYNYNDMVHYSGEINDYMTECFASGKCKIEEDNYADEIDKLVSLVENFDYSLFETEISTCFDVAKYIEECQNENYILSILVKGQDSIERGQWADELGRLGIQKMQDDPDSDLFWVEYNGGVAVSGNLLDKPSKEVKYENLQIDFGSETEPAIKINGTKYISAQNGLNIVVWDKSYDRVIDSVNINSASREIVHY